MREPELDWHRLASWRQPVVNAMRAHHRSGLASPSRQRGYDWVTARLRSEATARWRFFWESDATDVLCAFLLATASRKRGGAGRRDVSAATSWLRTTSHLLACPEARRCRYDAYKSVRCSTYRAYLPQRILITPELRRWWSCRADTCGTTFNCKLTIHCMKIKYIPT